MNTRVKAVALRVFGVFLIALLAAQAEPGAQANLDEEFKKVADAFSAAWAKADAKGIAALHTKDAIRFAGNGEPPAIGAEAIEMGFATALAGPYKGTTLSIKPNPSKRLSADTYIGEGTYAVEGGSVPAGAPTRGQYMNVMMRQGGRWLIAASAVMPATQPK